MAFEMLKTDYKDDILNTSVNQLRKYTIVNNPDGNISLIDVTSYSTTGTFIGAKDINTMCSNMNTIMGYIETSSGDLAQEFQDYFDEQKTLFETEMNNENADFVSQFETLLANFQTSSTNQFTTWYDANTANWSQEVEDRINAIIASLTSLVNDNGPFVLNKKYIVGNLLTWDVGDGITRGYLVINPVPANMGIYPTDENYFMMVTREGTPGIGLGLTPKGAWNNQETYVLNDLVIDSFIYWRCLEQNTDSKPSEINVKWHKEWDITAEIPIKFDDYTGSTTVPSLAIVIASLLSETTLGTLFSNIKAGLIQISDTLTNLTLNTVMEDEANLNNYTETGIYGFNTNPINSPVEFPKGYLEVKKEYTKADGNIICMQTWYQYPYMTYTRYKNYQFGYWNAWTQNLNTTNISNNFATTDPTKVAAAPLVKELKEDVNAINTNLTTANNKITALQKRKQAALYVEFTNYYKTVDISSYGTLPAYPAIIATVNTDTLNSAVLLFARRDSATQITFVFNANPGTIVIATEFTVN